MRAVFSPSSPQSSSFGFFVGSFLPLLWMCSNFRIHCNVEVKQTKLANVIDLFIESVSSLGALKAWLQVCGRRFPMSPILLVGDAKKIDAVVDHRNRFLVTGISLLAYILQRLSPPERTQIFNFWLFILKEIFSIIS